MTTPQSMHKVWLVSVAWALPMALCAEANNAPPVLRLGARADPVRVAAYADFTIPLELRNLSGGPLTIMEPECSLGTLDHRNAGTSPEFCPDPHIHIGPVVVDEAPDVVTIQSGEAYRFDYWLGSYGPATLAQGDYTVVVSYRAWPDPPWEVSPAGKGIRLETPPVRLVVRSPDAPLANEAMLALVAAEPRSYAGSALGELVLPGIELKTYLDALTGITQRWPETIYADRARWLMASALLESKRDSEAWPLLRELLEPERAYPLRGRVAIALAHSLHRAGHLAEAADALEHVTSRRGLYGWVQERWRREAEALRE